MTKVVADISMSLDGFVTGPDPDPEHGLGRGGEPLHTWAIDSEDVVDGPHGWGDDIGYGAEHAAAPPFFVVTHAAPQSVRLGLQFTFVTDGLETTLERARGAAGAKDVFVMGGGDVVGQCLDLGLVDELRIHLSPVVLGSGTPLFANVGRRELVQASVRVSTTATHLAYRLRPGSEG